MVFFLFFILFCIESKTENGKHKAVLKVIKRKRLMMITVVKGVRNEKWNKKICWILNERRADWCRVLNGFKKLQLVMLSGECFWSRMFYGMIWKIQCITTVIKIDFLNLWNLKFLKKFQFFENFKSFKFSIFWEKLKFLRESHSGSIYFQWVCHLEVRLLTSRCLNKLFPQVCHLTYLQHFL